MFRRLAAASVLAAVAVFLAAPAAGAHALVRSSEPASGALLDASPSRVVITFTERPDAALSSVHVLNSTGRAVETGKARAVPAAPLQLMTPVGSLEKGVYTVTWRVVSRVDGHLTAGAFSFGVGVSPAGAALPSGTTEATTPPPSPQAVAGRWLLYAGIALLAGFSAVTFFVFRAVPSHRALVIVAAVAALAGVTLTTIAEASSIGVAVSRLLRSSTGQGYARQLIAVAVVGLLSAVLLLKPARSSAAAIGVGVIALVVVHVIAGHAGGAIGNVQLKVAAQTFHVLVAGMWIGGLVWLLLGLRNNPEAAPSFVRRFSVMAGYLIALVALTGTVRALDLVGSWSGLWASSYGTALLIKVGFFTLIGVLGAVNRWRHVPALNTDLRGLKTFRKAVVAEIALAGVVLSATGAMAGFPPPKLVAASRVPSSPANVVVTGSDFATSIRIRLTATPGTAGPNLFEVRIADYDSGAPVGATRVAIRLSLPSRPDVGAQVEELSRVSDLVWRTQSAAMAIRATWNVVVIVEKPSGNVEVLLRLRPRLPPQKILVSEQPGQPTLYTIVLTDGRQVQAYLDPGDKRGSNDVHFTFFDSKGNEFSVDAATMSATPPGGDTKTLDVRRFGPGHFVATLTVDAGKWLFEVDSTSKSGGSIYAYFEPQIP